jgi:small-conductance mechanosensitive channel
MNNFADLIKESPTLNTAQHAIRFLMHHAGSKDLISFYIYIAIGLLATLAVYRFTAPLVRQFLRKSPPDITNRIAEAMRMPACLLVFSYFFIIAFDAITAMPPALWMHMHSDIYPILNGLLVLVCSFRIVDIIAQVLRKRWEGETTNLDERWADLIGRVGKLIVSIGAGLFIIQKIDPTFNIVPLLTGVSFVGAAIALASQSTIANAIGSMEIMIDRLFKEGDRISFGEYDGFVVRMGLRSITLAALTGEKINLPNKDLVDKQIRNYTRGKFNRTTITIGVLYDNDRPRLEQALKLMETVITSNPHINGCETNLHRFADSSIDLQVIFWADYKTSTEYNQLMNDLQLALKEAFDHAEIAFAFPTRTVYLKN